MSRMTSVERSLLSECSTSERPQLNFQVHCKFSSNFGQNSFSSVANDIIILEYLRVIINVLDRLSMSVAKLSSSMVEDLYLNTIPVAHLL